MEVPGLNVRNGMGIFQSFPVKIFESNYLPKRFRIEYYRGVGGYKNRWIIRKERKIELPPNIFIFQGWDLAIMRPETAALIRNYTT